MHRKEKNIMLKLLIEVVAIILTIVVIVKWPIGLIVIMAIALALNAIDSWKTNKVATILDIVAIILLIQLIIWLLT